MTINDNNQLPLILTEQDSSQRAVSVQVILRVDPLMHLSTLVISVFQPSKQLILHCI